VTDSSDMDATAAGRPCDGRGAPRLLEHCAAVERMLGSGRTSARSRLESMLGDDLTTLLCRALTRGPQPVGVFFGY
jgi:hypothetical protein